MGSAEWVLQTVERGWGRILASRLRVRRQEVSVGCVKGEWRERERTLGRSE